MGDDPGGLPRLPGLVLRSDDGRRLPLDTSRWHAEPTGCERDLLRDLPGPVLDVGCGPGRLVVGLARRGTVALGVDPAPGAVTLARRRGAPVLQRSVFDTIPGQGRWRTVLLIDGNIGIGGDPIRLLQRCRALAAPEGTIVAEVEPPGVQTSLHRARLECGPRHGPWFSWAVVGADAVGDVAGAAGLRICRIHHAGREGRWFAHLTPLAGPDVGAVA
jgi:SAM-dependent methyltransferase